MLIIVKTEGYITIFMISKITNNNETKEIDIKSHTCYYFNDTLLMTSILVIFYWSSILKYFSLSSCIWNLYVIKPLHIIEMDWFENIIELNISHNFLLIKNIIRCLLLLFSKIHEIKTDSCDNLSLKRTLKMKNTVTHIKSIFKISYNLYYSQLF